MSIMQTIFGSFKPNTGNTNNGAPVNPNGAQDNKLQNPPNQGTQQTPQTAPNGVVPEGGSNPPNKEESPLKQFEGLWQPNKTDDGNKTAPETQLTTEKFLEAAGKVDFTKVLNQEDLQKIAAGGQDAVAAFAAALNKTAQTVFGQSAAMAQKLAERSADAAREEVLKQLPSIIKQHSARESLLENNPAFGNPALQPVIEALKTQFTEKYPNASSKEVTKMTMDYLKGAADLINPPKAPENSGGRKGKASEEDWSAYLG